FCSWHLPGQERRQRDLQDRQWAEAAPVPVQAQQPTAQPPWVLKTARRRVRWLRPPVRQPELRPAARLVNPPARTRVAARRVHRAELVRRPPIRRSEEHT